MHRGPSASYVRLRVSKRLSISQRGQSAWCILGFAGVQGITRSQGLAIQDQKEGLIQKPLVLALNKDAILLGIWNQCLLTLHIPGATLALGPYAAGPRFREAAVLAYGSIMEVGPGQDTKFQDLMGIPRLQDLE